jgi:hypothetical protein
VKVKHHQFNVSVFLHKVSGKDLQYAIYGAYSGELWIHDIVDDARESIIDVGLKDLAVCISNMDDPKVIIQDKVLAYELKKGNMSSVQFLETKLLSRC